MDSLITMAASTAATVISGAVLFLLKKFFNAQKERELHRDRMKARENELILRSLNALGRLCVANCIALRDGRTNGEMSGALCEYEKIEKEMYSYLISKD